MSNLPKLIFAASTGAVLAFACTVGTGMDDVAKADTAQPAVAASSQVVLELSYDSSGVGCVDDGNRPSNDCCPNGFSEVGVNARGGGGAAVVCLQN
mgnify:CR=1 FL=1